jgi:hypothetical protein
MRKLLLLAIVLLNGCTLVDAYLMTKYDPNEYNLITLIRSDAARFKTTCADAGLSKNNAIRLANETAMFKNYSENIPRNADGFKAATSLNEIAVGLVDRYNSNDTVSQIFCKLKFEGIEHSASLMQHTIGNKPR